MSRLATTFERCRERNETALVCYLTAGYPDKAAAEEYMIACAEGGADVLEIGVPFSDPIADGPVIQASSQVALEKGTRPKDVFLLVKRLRKRTDIPIVLMGYYNPIFRIGEDAYAEMTSRCGADGLVVPDLPFDESAGLMRACRKNGLDLVQFIAPTTPKERARRIAQASSGYIYLISRLGITGDGQGVNRDIGQLVKGTKRAANGVPVAVGFGISNAEQVAIMRQAGVDAVIIGSALIRQVANGVSPDGLRSTVHELKDACRQR